MFFVFSDFRSGLNLFENPLLSHMSLLSESWSTHPSIRRPSVDVKDRHWTLTNQRSIGVDVD